MKTLRESLADYDTTLLRAIAERLGVELTTNHQPGMVEEIAVSLLETDALSEVLTWLSDEERQALDALVARDGRMRVHRFVQRFGEIRRLGPGRMARDAPWRNPVSAAEGLWYRGLIARSFAPEENTVIEFAFVPSDLLALLPPPRSTRKPFVVPLADEPDVVTLGGTEAIDDMCTLLSLVQNYKVHMHGDRLQARDIETLETQFLEQGGERLTLLLHLAQTIGLLNVDGRTLRVGRDKARDWLKDSRASQIWELQETWARDAAWDDLRHVSGIRCEETGWRNDPLVARETVLGLLSRCRTHTWLSIAGYVDAVREQYPDYARPDGDFDSWYIRDARTGEFLSGLEHWDRIEGALLVFLLSGPMHWLGMISLGYPEGRKAPTAFRLTPWGTAFLGLSEVPIEELPVQPARVLPEGGVRLAREALLHDRFQLARFADWQSSGPEYSYVITPASLVRALGSDIQIEMVERFLQRITDDSVPAAAIAHIRSWGGRYGKVRMRRVALLETHTPQLMRELRAHERVRSYLRQALSPTIAVVRESDWDVLIQELHRAGYLPETSEH